MEDDKARCNVCGSNPRPRRHLFSPSVLAVLPSENATQMPPPSGFVAEEDYDKCNRRRLHHPASSPAVDAPLRHLPSTPSTSSVSFSLRHLPSSPSTSAVSCSAAAPAAALLDDNQLRPSCQPTFVGFSSSPLTPPPPCHSPSSAKPTSFAGLSLLKTKLGDLCSGSSTLLTCFPFSPTPSTSSSPGLPGSGFLRATGEEICDVCGAIRRHPRSSTPQTTCDGSSSATPIPKPPSSHIPAPPAPLLWLSKAKPEDLCTLCGRTKRRLSFCPPSAFSSAALSSSPSSTPVHLPSPPPVNAILEPPKMGSECMLDFPKARTEDICSVCGSTKRVPPTAALPSDSLDSGSITGNSAAPTPPRTEILFRQPSFKEWLISSQK